MSAILTEAVGEPALAYARTRLFEPLGIDTRPAMTADAVPQNRTAYDRAGFAWPTDPQENQAGFSFLKLTPPDMAKLGQLFLDDGEWEGAGIVPAEWVAAATTAQFEIGGGAGYGYQWWIYPVQDHPAYAAEGFGGQLIQVVPELDLIIVTACNVDETDVGVLTADHLAQTINDLVLSELGL